MRALLLSAGLGTRLRPVTDTIPKCLVPINGKPLIEYWLRMLAEAKVSPILVNTHYFSEKVESCLDQSQFRNHVQTVFEKHLLGTGGTILKNLDFFEDEPFMVIHGDNFSRFDVSSFIAAHSQRPAACEITMMLFKTDIPETCGIVELDERGIVQKFHEKVKNPPGNLANGAVYIFEPTVLSFLKGLGKEVIDISTEVLPNYLGRIYTFLNNVYHRDIGNLASYNQAQQDATKIW